jgi:hypothetical protein
MIARLLCKYLGHRKYFRIMGPWVRERRGLFMTGHNATAGCFYCGWRRRQGAVWLSDDGVV